jgi:hypothetical protein
MRTFRLVVLVLTAVLASKLDAQSLYGTVAGNVNAARNAVMAGVRANQYLSRSPVRDQATINALTVKVPNPSTGLLPGTTWNGSTVQAAQLLEAFPQFTGVTLQNENIGSSYFQMFQTRVHKRFSRLVW